MPIENPSEPHPDAPRIPLTPEEEQRELDIFVLGLPENATPEEIRAAKRKLNRGAEAA